MSYDSCRLLILKIALVVARAAYCNSHVAMVHVTFKKMPMSGLPTVPYLTVQYRILTLVPYVPGRDENVPYF